MLKPPHLKSVVPGVLACCLTLAACASVETDQNYIDAFAWGQESDGQVELSLVRAAGDGVIELYSGRGDGLGRLLDREEVFAGVNADIRLRAPITEARVIAVLRIDAEIVARRTLFLR